MGIAFAAFCKSVPELPPGSGSASTKITENVIIPLLYSFAWLNIAVTYSARNLAMEVCQREDASVSTSNHPAYQQRENFDAGTCVLTSSRADSEKILNGGDTNLLSPNTRQ